MWDLWKEHCILLPHTLLKSMDGAVLISRGDNSPISTILEKWVLVLQANSKII